MIHALPHGRSLMVAALNVKCGCPARIIGLQTTSHPYRIQGERALIFDQRLNFCGHAPTLLPPYRHPAKRGRYQPADSIDICYDAAVLGGFMNALVRRVVGVWCLVCAGSLLADAPPPVQSAGGGWGEVSGNLQARISAVGTPAIAAPILVRAELKNLASTELSKQNVRVWLLVAQGKDHIYYTAAHVATPQIVAAQETMEIQFDAGLLAAYRYAPEIEIRDGLPTASAIAGAKKAAASAPEPLGKMKDLLAAGAVRVKAFVVLTSESGEELERKPIVVASATVSMNLGEAPPVEFGKLDAAGKKALLEQITAGLLGDAVAGKNAHDRAVQIGEPAVLPMLSLVGNASLSGAGQMWLVSTLVDLKDPRTIEPLIQIVEQGGPGARVACYHGPKLKDARLTAAIQKVAATTKDPKLMAWAARGLGINGEKVDPKLFEAMVSQSDPFGRVEATAILGASADPKSAPLLAKLVSDTESAVRYRAIAEIAIHGRKEPEIMAALEQATKHQDAQTAKIARQCIDKLKNY
ncbi:MAG: HEAT repeat domain-containing protein [Phycisphaerales bacterium]|nr:HEAT repeat domain-containing protein [Phycisphaerales bacterium]